MQLDLGRSRRSDWATEVLLLSMACLAPWAFGSVEAWALTALDAGVIVLAILGNFTGRSRPEGGRQVCLPGIALACLALLGFVQSAAITSGQPGATSASNMGGVAIALERVVGDLGPIVPLPAASLSRIPEETRNVAWRLVSAWVIFASVISLQGGAASLRRFGTAIVVNASALSVFSMVQALTWNGKIYWFRDSPQEGAWFAGGPFVCHSHLTAYLNIGLGFALASLMRPRGQGSRLWAGYASALIAVGIVASQSRSGFAAMLGALVVVICLKPRLLRDAAGPAGVAVVVGLLLLILPGRQAINRLATLFDLNARGYTARFEIWGQAIDAWRASPTWGQGFGSFGAAIAPFGLRDRGVFFARAENEYLDLLVEGGAMGLGLGLMGLVGLALLGRRAVTAEKASRDGLIVLGAIFGLVALMIQSLGDFALHIPAIALTATILAAHLSGIGLKKEVRSQPPTVASARTVRRLAVGVASVALALGAFFHDLPLLRAEAVLGGSDLPLPGTSSPSLRSPMVPKDALERRLAALDKALRQRPDWSEGHLRRGITLVALYERAAKELVEESTGDSKRAVVQGDILWLHAVMHSHEGLPPPSRSELIEHEPVRLYLIPAARSYLEARRCGEIIAQTHAGLASLDFLLEGSDPSSHARRGSDLAGADRQLHLFLGEVAAQAGDSHLAKTSFRKALAASDLDWEPIADRAAELFPPEEILRDILPADGRLPLLFADRLYSELEDRQIRDVFLRVALERIPGDPNLSPAERFQVEALAWSSLGDREQACARMGLALGLDPTNVEWREKLSQWLLDSGRVVDALRQTSIGLQLSPGHAGLARVRDAAADFRARSNEAANFPDETGKTLRDPTNSF